MQKPDRSTYTPHDFLQWRESKTLELTPKFQRRGVWTPGARSFFIDTILRQMPIPPIYIRLTQSGDRRRLVREVIDGQQRISCILDFLDGKFKLSSSLKGAPWAGKRFDRLSTDEQDRIRSYGFSTEVFQSLSDIDVLNIFSRLNTYSVPLNAQELRNGRYFGLFKQCVYGLSLEHLEFWRRHSIFSERNIARMLEVELTSELMIAQIGGMQDKKKSIDKFYADFDDAFPAQKENEERFRDVIDTLNEAFPSTLSDSEFSRVPLFYSLFCAIYHRHYGLPNNKLVSVKKRSNKTEKLSLADAVQKLSDLVATARAGDATPKEYETFVAACLRQTDNIRPRQDRMKTIYELAFGAN